MYWRISLNLFCHQFIMIQYSVSCSFMISSNKSELCNPSCLIFSLFRRSLWIDCLHHSISIFLRVISLRICYVDSPEKNTRACLEIARILAPVILRSLTPHLIEQGEKQAREQVIILLLQHPAEILLSLRREIETMNVRMINSSDY